MDSLKSLFEKQQYSLIVNLLKDSSSGEDVFYYVNALIQLGQYSKAIKAASDYRKSLWEYSPIKTLTLIFDLRFTLKQFDEAYEDFKYFENLPYVSQEVEEKLHELPTLIRTAERQSLMSEVKVDETSIKNSFLNDDDDYKILVLMDQIKGQNINNYIDELITLVGNPKRHLHVRVYALLLLVFVGLNKEVEFISIDKTLKVNPSLLKKPFESKEFLNAETTGANLCKNSAVINVFRNLLGNYQMSIYPKLIEEENIELLVRAILSISSNYLNDQIDKNLLLSKDINEEDLNSEINHVNEILAKVPPLKY